MRGIARLAVTVEGGVPFDPDNPMPCAVCGRVAESNVWPFSNSFTDRQLLLHSEYTVCSACLAVGKGPPKIKNPDGSRPADRPPDMRMSPYGGAGYILAEGKTTLLSVGVDGLHNLLHVAENDGPFGALIGKWETTAGGPRHSHWLQTPVAYGGSTSFPVYFHTYYKTVDKKRIDVPIGVVWLRCGEIASVIGLVEKALEDGVTMDDLWRDTRHDPQFSAMMRPPINCLSEPPHVVRAAVMDHILFALPPKQKGKSAAGQKETA